MVQDFKLLSMITFTSKCLKGIMKHPFYFSIFTFQKKLKILKSSTTGI